MFDGIEQLLTGAPWAYAIIAAIVALDAVFPVVPGETAVITGGVLAAQGDLSTALVATSAFAGVLIGDNASYLLGSTLGRRARSRLLRGRKARRRLEWAACLLRERGLTIILVARFIPGGRTTATFSSGALGLEWRRFLVADAVAAAVWSTYGALLGRLGGEAFSDSFWPALLVALAVAGLATLAGELYRRRRARRAAATAPPGERSWPPCGEGRRHPAAVEELVGS